MFPNHEIQVAQQKAYMTKVSANGRPKAKVSRLGAPGALRAQPCLFHQKINGIWKGKGLSLGAEHCHIKTPWEATSPWLQLNNPLLLVLVIFIGHVKDWSYLYFIEFQNTYLYFIDFKITFIPQVQHKHSGQTLWGYQMQLNLWDVSPLPMTTDKASNPAEERNSATWDMMVFDVYLLP